MSSVDDMVGHGDTLCDRPDPLRIRWSRSLCDGRRLTRCSFPISAHSVELGRRMDGSQSLF